MNIPLTAPGLDRHTFAHRSRITLHVHRNHAANYIGNSAMTESTPNDHGPGFGPCSGCPHPTGCSRIGECLTTINAREGSSNGTPRYMTQNQAKDVLTALRAGSTLRRFTNGGAMGPAIVSLTKYHAHKATFPEWADVVTPLEERNRIAADYLKGPEWKRQQTHCKRGHLLSGENLGIKNLGPKRAPTRFCRTCNREQANFGGVIKPEVVIKVKELLLRGVPVGHIQSSSRGSKHYTVSAQTLTRYRRENPDFNLFVIDATKDNQRLSQVRRYQRLKSAAAREQANDYYTIRGMVPTYLPDHVRDDITQDVMIAMLEGSLALSDVRQRIGKFVTDHNRLFPTKFAKFGDSPLVSLDQVLFDDGNTTRGDTVSRGLWD
jgi:hypothetical protein